MPDAVALTRAFGGVTSAFVLLPPVFDPAPDFAEAREVIAAVSQALAASGPAKVVCLSTVGAQAQQTNLLSQHTLVQESLAKLALPITFLRPAWFLENMSWDIAPARETGILSSYLQPLDKPVPMVATADVGRVAAELLLQDWQGKRIVELEGPRPVTPNEIAAELAKALGRPVRAQAVPRGDWESMFKAQGMRNPPPRMQMLDGFNQGWITFEGQADTVLQGRVGLAEVVRQLVA
jgi:uncharacterized protein YbjT (DUF2867 family)